MYTRTHIPAIRGNRRTRERTYMRVAVRRPMAVALAVAFTWAASAAALAQEQVASNTDGTTEELDQSLQAKVDAGATETVPVLVTVSGGPSRVQSLLTGQHTARGNKTSLIVGRVPVQVAPKVASLGNVVSVTLVQRKQTGQPADRPEDHHRPSLGELRRKHHQQEETDVPYDRAPKLKGSNFEKLKNLNLFDARSHTFTEAWNAGYTGEGSTVGVMDGGTDFGHPDLIGTYQTWAGATNSDTTDKG